MRKKERWPMYFAIQEQKKLGLRKSQVARNLNISRNTVIKLWDMTVDEYKEFLDSLETRSKKLESFETEIVSWLRKYPDLSGAHVMDWLQERYKNVKVAESTVRNYVRGLRMEYGIPKEKRIRQYEAVEDFRWESRCRWTSEKPSFGTRKVIWSGFGSSPLFYPGPGINT